MNYHNFLLKYGYILIYGVSLALLLFFLKWLQWRYLIVDNSADTLSSPDRTIVSTRRRMRPSEVHPV